MVKHYSKPGRVNLVSLLIFFALASGIYSLVQFGPLYYRKWKVKGVLSETANRIYPKRMLSGPDEAEFFAQVRKDVEAQLREIGIEDRGLRVQLYKTPQIIAARVMYQEVVTHPLVNKTTILHFGPYVTVAIRKNE
jgi:hypothetical protein